MFWANVPLFVCVWTVWAPHTPFTRFHAEYFYKQTVRQTYRPTDRLLSCRSEQIANSCQNTRIKCCATVGFSGLLLNVVSVFSLAPSSIPISFPPFLRVHCCGVSQPVENHTVDFSTEMLNLINYPAIKSLTGLYRIVGRKKNNDFWYIWDNIVCWSVGELTQISCRPNHRRRWPDWFRTFFFLFPNQACWVLYVLFAKRLCAVCG